MKAFSIACEDAFHLRFKGITFQDDVSIHIWREGWNAAMCNADQEISALIATLEQQLKELRRADHK
jgi:hypothetical protein